MKEFDKLPKIERRFIHEYGVYEHKCYRYSNLSIQNYEKMLLRRRRQLITKLVTEEE